ncbi:MAG: GldG family protein [Marinilabiliales bacterium]|nr:GldG family protein [Marinilabiliales bacterium]
MMLAAVYSAIGLFASSLTGNQVIAFILAAVISFIMFTGFDSLSLLPGLSSIGEEVSAMGINEHYKSISRGVLDIRDVAYFIFVTVLFNEAARISLRRSSLKKPLYSNSCGGSSHHSASPCFHIRIDLTEDRRFTLAEPTRKILKELDRDVQVDVFLDGEMPVGFRKLRRSAGQYLDEFRIISRQEDLLRLYQPLRVI